MNRFSKKGDCSTFLCAVIITWMVLKSTNHSVLTTQMEAIPWHSTTYPMHQMEGMLLRLQTPSQNACCSCRNLRTSTRTTRRMLRYFCCCSVLLYWASISIGCRTLRKKALAIHRTLVSTRAATAQQVAIVDSMTVMDITGQQDRRLC